MADDEALLGCGETGVEGHQYTARPDHGEKGLEMLGNIGGKHRHAIAGTDTRRAQ